MELIDDCLAQAGLTNAFSVIDEEDFLGAVDESDLYDALANGSFYRFLQSLMQPRTLPATYQKLADLGWTDDEIAKLVEGNVLHEASISLTYAINAGALSLEEYNEYASVPNQEISLLFYTDNAGGFLEWLQERMTVPKIDHAAFGG